MWTRATNHQWIEAACRELTRVTGWLILFVPDSSSPTEAARRFAWRSEISDGNQRVGTLGVVMPVGRKPDESFLRACDYTDLVARLIQGVVAEQSAAADLRTPAPPTGAESTSTEAGPADPWTLAVNRVLDVTLQTTGLRAAALLAADPQAAGDGLRLRAVRTHDGQPPLTFPRPLCEFPFDADSFRSGPIVIRRQNGRLCEWLPDGMSLAVCCQLRTHETLGGVLWVFDRRDRRLMPREQHLLLSVASRLGDLAEKAVLVEESELQRKLRTELRIASETQTPPSNSSVQLGGWCQVASRLETYREVGGDLCEVIPLDEERLLLVIGDAAGHSVPAALIMATVRGALRLVVEEPVAEDLRPEQVVTRLNRVLHGVVESYQFMTLTCALIDRRRETVQIANAGHPPSLLIRDEEVHQLEQSGLVLGVDKEADYHSRVVTLEPGDVLVFYTDGVSEARGRDQQLFRQEGIVDVVRRHVDRTAEQIVSEVWSNLGSHLADDDHDDRTLLVVSIGTPCSVETPPVELAATTVG